MRSSRYEFAGTRCFFVAFVAAAAFIASVTHASARQPASSLLLLTQQAQAQHQHLTQRQHPYHQQQLPHQDPRNEHGYDIIASTSTALSTATAAAAAAASSDPPPQPQPQPKWRSQFTVRFNETTRILLTRHTEGAWYYDAEGGREALYRSNGNGDRYCGSVHPLTQTPCAHIVTEGQRYLVFPELAECCMCCTAAQGCGVLATSWLQGASFEGTVVSQGLPAFKWRRDGLQPNYWYTTADEAQIPLQLDQMPNDLTTFLPETFLEGPPPPAVFELPPDCKPRCPLTSICTLLATASQQTTSHSTTTGTASSSPLNPAGTDTGSSSSRSAGSAAAA
ncbi:hypothetical protein Agub_g15887 [Astrephomene gubernaculifera]|uniref:Uncharacterized protein n=1 Tax=Astrephomene gubernaculifera TaxID=47775 RepID=A0AAD3HTF3_9CHLO|nr:hypothetical protein Agub_g15887 [Astrephomene gubernaculifera]